MKYMILLFVFVFSFSESSFGIVAPSTVPSQEFQLWENPISIKLSLCTTSLDVYGNGVISRQFYYDKGNNDQGEIVCTLSLILKPLNIIDKSESSIHSPYLVQYEVTDRSPTNSIVDIEIRLRPSDENRYFEDLSDLSPAQLRSVFSPVFEIISISIEQKPDASFK